MYNLSTFAKDEFHILPGFFTLGDLDWPRDPFFEKWRHVNIYNFYTVRENHNLTPNDSRFEIFRYVQEKFRGFLIVESPQQIIRNNYQISKIYKYIKIYILI